MVRYTLVERATARTECGVPPMNPGALGAGMIAMSKYVVRYGVMRNLGVFSTSRGETFSRGAKVIARTNRGLEAGEVLSEASEHAVQSLRKPKHGQILRRQSHDDEHELKKIHEQERAE